MNHGTCVHFKGIQHECCGAGVNYEREFGGETWRAPCIEYILKSERGGTLIRPGERAIRKEWRQAGVYPLPCSRRVEPTDEQVLADQQRTLAALDRHIQAATVVSAWRTWSKTNRVAKRGVIECPCCKGRLHLSQAAYNGHVHGKCETKGCLSWME